jgi:hypothetical protein
LSSVCCHQVETIALKGHCIKFCICSNHNCSVTRWLYYATFRMSCTHKITNLLFNLQYQAAAVFSHIQRHSLFEMSLNVRESGKRLILKVKCWWKSHQNWSRIYLKISKKLTWSKWFCMQDILKVTLYSYPDKEGEITMGS